MGRAEALTAALDALGHRLADAQSVAAAHCQPLSYPEKVAFWEHNSFLSFTCQMGVSDSATLLAASRARAHCDQRHLRLASPQLPPRQTQRGLKAPHLTRLELRAGFTLPPQDDLARAIPRLDRQAFNAVMGIVTGRQPELHAGGSDTVIDFDRLDALTLRQLQVRGSQVDL